MFSMYPMWAIPVAAVCFELAWLSRKKKTRMQYLFWASGLFLFITGAFWAVYPGERTPWGVIEYFSELF